MDNTLDCMALLQRISCGLAGLFEIDCTPIEDAISFAFLGQLLSSDGKSEGYIKRRISIAKSTFNNTRSTLTNKSTSFETKKNHEMLHLVHIALWCGDMDSNSHCQTSRGFRNVDVSQDVKGVMDRQNIR